MAERTLKAPFPWFGGKADAAPTVWAALGDVQHYVEPFAGSLAVLLRRPHPCNRTYYSETVNDLDSLLCNAWRAITRDPDAVAEAASWPVCKADLSARHLALVAWRSAGNAERLAADPEFYDAKMAGWWLWGQSCWIGGGWCSGTGPWAVSDDGRIEKREGGAVSRRRPYLTGEGKGVQHPANREAGVHAKKPHLTTDGRGGVAPQLRVQGVAQEDEFHPMTMPELRRWMQLLSARLRHVRVLNGSWERVCTSGSLQTLGVRQGGHAGVFVDPPYDSDERIKGLYTHDSGAVAAEARAWCAENGENPRYRIVLAGFDTEHIELEARGWRVVEWFRGGFLKGGMGHLGHDAHQQHRERLWLSPHCLHASSPQLRLF